MLLSETRLRIAFNMFDLDDNGQITAKELQHVLTSGIKKISEDDWEELIWKYDENHDGEINYDEFKNLMIHIYATTLPKLSMS